MADGRRRLYLVNKIYTYLGMNDLQQKSNTPMFSMYKWHLITRTHWYPSLWNESFTGISNTDVTFISSWAKHFLNRLTKTLILLWVSSLGSSFTSVHMVHTSTPSPDLIVTDNVEEGLACLHTVLWASCLFSYSTSVLRHMSDSNRVANQVSVKWQNEMIQENCWQCTTKSWQH